MRRLPRRGQATRRRLAVSCGFLCDSSDEHIFERCGDATDAFDIDTGLFQRRCQLGRIAERRAVSEADVGALAEQLDIEDAWQPFEHAGRAISVDGYDFDDDAGKAGTQVCRRIERDELTLVKQRD